MEELMKNNILYDVIFFWDNTREDIEYKQYCSETLCNILKYNPELSVKLVYEAAQKGKTLIMTTRNIEKATEIRDTLLAMELNCQICPTQTDQLIYKKC